MLRLDDLRAARIVVVVVVVQEPRTRIEIAVAK
jgi:hypothetical protein